MVNIVGIGGSLRTNSHSMQALQLAADRVEAAGATAKILDLRDMALPFCDGGDGYPDNPDVAILQSTVKQADGLILSTLNIMAASAVSLRMP